MTARRVLGRALGALVRAWTRTLTVVVESAPGSGGTACVFAFLHGDQLALVAARRELPPASFAALVSHSRDGELQAAVMRTLGVSVVRGSSSRGGASGLRALVRRVRQGHHAAFAVDGPRGPRGVPKPGAAETALIAHAALVPVASASRRKVVLARAWDAFEIPLPFSRVAVVLGAPVASDAARSDPSLLADAIRRARSRAEALVAP